MWNRAPRAQISDANRLPNISPASYTPYSKFKTKACHVPFNCSAPALALADNGVPAPCTYTIRYRKHRIKGGASLRFTEPRNTFTHIPGPSPISYDPDLLYERSHKYQIGRKILRGKPPRYGLVPSISVPYKLFDGFDIIKGKGLVLRPVRLDFKQRIEPMLQHFPYELNKTTLKYKGNQWSKLKAKRKFLYSGDPNTPGVGHYNLLDKPPKSLDIFLTKLRALAVRKADSLRWTDMFIKNIVNEDFPSPAEYHVNAVSIYYRQSFNALRTFTTAKRFQYPKIITLQQPLNLFPPPTITSTQRFWPPFNHSSIARPKIQVSLTSPASYYIKNNSISDDLKKKLNKQIYFVSFNSLMERKTALILNENPGPGTYNLLNKQKRIIYGVRDANSYIPAIKLKPLWDTEKKEVAPWTYDISLAMKSVYNKKDCHKGPTWIKEKKFDRTKWAIKDGPDNVYMIRDIGASHAGQPIFNERPKKSAEITPGPADYLIHPTYAEACVKAIWTHNATSDLKKIVYQNSDQQLVLKRSLPNEKECFH